MYPLIRKLLFQFSPERAHHLTLRIAARWPRAVRMTAGASPPSARLSQKVCGLTFAHPVGLAAGLDKDGEAIASWAECGFAFAELGTVTPLPQPGNPPPRLFRLVEDDALINRMGFNNKGAGQMAGRLLQWQTRHSATRQGARMVVGVNFGKNKLTENDRANADYLSLLEQLGTLADYFVINVSSPNTPGLRDLQSTSSLVPMVQQMLTQRDVLDSRPPLFVKLAPDLADETLEELACSLMAAGVDGLIATNTTVDHKGVRSPLASQAGGLSGRPLEPRSTAVVRLLYRATHGLLPIIGSGGVFTVDDAYRKIRAGASLVQIYTSFIYRGPGVVRELVTGLDARLAQDGFAHLSEAVGVDA